MILDEIAEYAKIRVEKAKELISEKEMIQLALTMPKGNYSFETALRAGYPAIISEVKKASPSKGIIDYSFHYLEIAKEYETIGASCISVLTEPKWFLGSDAIFKEIRKNITIPMLRKDFTVDAYQIYEAKVMGADAILLIAALLDTNTIREYLSICKNLGICALVETHNKEEIQSAINAGATMIGVNNRNLKNFTVNLEQGKMLRNEIPKDKLFVAESGILTEADGIDYIRTGADALLIGEALMKHQSRKEFVQAIKTPFLMQSKIKICGLHHENDIDYVNNLRPDYAGFILEYEKSHRNITKEQLKTFTMQLNREIQRVGVFVDQSIEKIINYAEYLDIIQLHGKESKEYIAQLKERLPSKEIWKAVLVRTTKDVQEANQSNADLILLDYGYGMGQSFDWDLLCNVDRPFILAGGLNLDNVKIALQKYRPFAIDVSSGVETDGHKDEHKIRQMIQMVRK